MRHQEAGFTLIELVVVIVILGILAAVAIPQYLDMSTQAKDAAKNGGKSSVASALALAIADAKGPATTNQVIAKLPGSTCSGGGVRIAGTGADFVSVPLNDSSGNALTGCASASAVAVGTPVYAST